MHQSAVRLALRAAIVGLVVALPVSASAPPDQYEFFTADSALITDHFTGLVWERVVGPRLSYDNAKTRCANASMRLPSVKELLTIVDEEPHLEYEGTQDIPKYIDRAAFPKTPSGVFWTLSEIGGRVLTVDFSDGATLASDKGSNSFVRCVDTP